MKKNHFDGLDGLRVYAITMVIACHVGLLAASSGGIGNKIFFSLSGFLGFYSLKSIHSAKDIFVFYWKKIKRIIPAYYLLLIFASIAFPTMIVATDLQSASGLLPNMLFQNQYAHLWFLQQIMLMYLVSPIFYLIVVLIEKAVSNKTAAYLGCAVLFVVLAFLEKRYFTADILRLSGDESHSQFAVWMFMIGFSTALFYEALCSAGYDSKIKKSKPWCVLCYLYEIVFFLLLFVSVIPSAYVSYPVMVSVLEGEVIRTLLSCLCILTFALTPHNWIKKVLDNALFRHISNSSFEIYIIHFFIMACFGNLGPKRQFIAVYVVSFCIAYCVHQLVQFKSNTLFSKRS